MWGAPGGPRDEGKRPREPPRQRLAPRGRGPAERETVPAVSFVDFAPRALLLVLFLLAAAGCDERVDRSAVDLEDGRTLRTIRAGTGNSRVIFEADLGDGADAWAATDVFRDLTRETRLLSYSRAGYAGSDEDPAGRSLERVVDDLAGIVTAIPRSDRLVMVGHGLGGAVIRAFAATFPGDVDGLVFIDATHEDFSTVSQEDEDRLVESVQPIGAGAVADARELRETLDALGELGPLPPIPTVALTSVVALREAGVGEEDEARWVAAHASLGEDASSFRQTVTETAGHYIQVDDPDLVVAAIREVLSRAE